MLEFRKIAGVAPGAALLFASANAETQTYDLSGFQRISASAGVGVIVRVGGDYAIRAEGRAESLERLSVRIKGDALEIGRESQRFNLRWRNWRAPSVHVSLPALIEASTSSGSELSASGVSAKRFEASASSGSKLELSGACGRLVASASMGSQFDAASMACRDVEIDTSTGATARVYASDRVDASASTGADVQVFGSPEKRDISQSAGGDVDIE